MPSFLSFTSAAGFWRGRACSLRLVYMNFWDAWRWKKVASTCISIISSNLHQKDLTAFTLSQDLWLILQSLHSLALSNFAWFVFSSCESSLPVWIVSSFQTVLRVGPSLLILKLKQPPASAMVESGGQQRSYQSPAPLWSSPSAQRGSRLLFIYFFCKQMQHLRK